MSSEFSKNVQVQIVGTVVGTVILSMPTAIVAAAVPLLAGALGEWTTHLIEVVLGTATFLFMVIAGYYYYLVLPDGKNPAGSPGRNRYDRLRMDLAKGGTAARIYSDKLTAALNAVDVFFRDAGAAGQKAFGLQTPAPLWTAASFDRCLLLALIYPVAIIFLIWAVSGDVGPAEAALGMPRDLPSWQRGFGFVATVAMILAYWKSQRTNGLSAVRWFLVAVAAGVPVAVSLAYSSGTSAVTGGIAIVSAVVGAVAGSVAISAVGLSIGAVVGALSGTGGVVGDLVGGSAAALAALSAVYLRSALGATNFRAHTGAFWVVLLLALTIACMAAPLLLSAMSYWPIFGPLLLFIGLLTLITAPFDWFSLGLTRALLRRGLEREMWWPYFYAIVDAAFAVIVIALLACAMVIGIQAFDLMAVRGGGNPILPLDELFRGIEANPAAPKYWWLYALFLSTMVPSLVNLMIGGLSLTRGIPRLSAYLHRLMDSNGAVSDFDQIQIASLLGGQFVIGVTLGITAQAILAFGLFRYAMPSLGVGLLDLARAVAALDLPGRLFGLF